MGGGARGSLALLLRRGGPELRPSCVRCSCVVPVPVVPLSPPVAVMVRTKADCLPGSYRKVVAARAPRKALGHASFTNSSPSPPSRKVESKYAGGNPVCVRPTPTWQKGIGEFFGMSSKHPEKENQFPDEAEAGSSGLGKPKRKSRPLQPDPTEGDGCPDEE
ncbi:PCNA-associated factor [Notamacropus eugenii]|uniref:PCNA-associated factor n=1 Tax=Notamacropus eugenii TaxID=9315 RepID=UPI003B67A2F6